MVAPLTAMGVPLTEVMVSGKWLTSVSLASALTVATEPALTPNVSLTAAGGA